MYLSENGDKNYSLDGYDGYKQFSDMPKNLPVNNEYVLLVMNINGLTTGNLTKILSYVLNKTSFRLNDTFVSIPVIKHC